MIAALARFDRARLDTLLAAAGKLRVAVLGDFFLDKYMEVDPRLGELSLETGKSAHQVVAVRHSPGAAGTVVNNLASLMAGGGGRIAALGFTGDDGDGWELRQDLSALGVDVTHLHTDRVPGRRTPVYLKPRDIAVPGLEGEHSRYDLKNRAPTGPGLEGALVDSARAVLPGADILVVMDQVEDDGYGAVTPTLRAELARMLPGLAGLVAWADSRRRIGHFHGFIRKMNQFELMGIHDPEPGASLPDATVLGALPAAEEAAAAAVFVTAGERGVWVGGGPAPVLVPAVKIQGPVDPTGAGDSFTAGAVLALAAGASRTEAALVGTLTASVTVRKLGTTGTATPAELRKALDLWKEQNP